MADSIDIGTITWHGVERIPAPASLAMLPLLKGVEYRPGTAQQNRNVGVRPIIESDDFWPNFIPPGWSGPVRYTVCAIVQIDGQWHGAPCVYMYDGAWGTGAPILTQWHDWVYWSPTLKRYQPKVGDRIGFMLLAGAARFDVGQLSRLERSNIIEVRLDEAGVWYPEPANSPQPIPEPPAHNPEPIPSIPAPEQPANPPAIPDVDLSPLLDQLTRIADGVDRLAKAWGA